MKNSHFAITGGALFLVINITLFYRIVCSDGLLGEAYKPKAGGGR